MCVVSQILTTAWLEPILQFNLLVTSLELESLKMLNSGLLTEIPDLLRCKLQNQNPPLQSLLLIYHLGPCFLTLETCL